MVEQYAGKLTAIKPHEAWNNLALQLIRIKYATKRKKQNSKRRKVSKPKKALNQPWLGLPEKPRNGCWSDLAK